MLILGWFRIAIWALRSQLFKPDFKKALHFQPFKPVFFISLKFILKFIETPLLNNQFIEVPRFTLDAASPQEALAQQPCGVASKNEQQGEAIAFGKARHDRDGCTEPVATGCQGFQRSMMDKAKAEAKAMAEAKAKAKAAKAVPKIAA
eukprot:Skav205998  [mRNA]  locus=scaffold2084:363770:364846:- [translate_table: standard]